MQSKIIVWNELHLTICVKMQFMLWVQTLLSEFYRGCLFCQNMIPMFVMDAVQLPTCTLLKCIYDPVDTHVRAHFVTSEVLMEFYPMKRIYLWSVNWIIISHMVKNGQPLHQIYLCHVDELTRSGKTLNNYVNAQLFGIRNIDLPHVVKYRPSYKQHKSKWTGGVAWEWVFKTKRIWESWRSSL